jgi:hypothetical protein
MYHDLKKWVMHTELYMKIWGNKPLGKSRSRWRDNTKINLKEMRHMSVDYIHVTQDWY